MEDNDRKIDKIKYKDLSYEEKKLRRKRMIQIISFVAFIAFIVLGTIIAYPIAKELKTEMQTEEGIATLSEKLGRYSGIWGVLVFLFIQTLQVILAVLPPIQLVGGMMFGWLWGGILSFAGVCLGSLIIYTLVQKIGTPIVEAFVNEKQIKKFKFLQDEKKLTGILIILYLIPGIPKDVITYIVPLTKVTKKDFFFYVMPFRLPAVMMSTVLGNNFGKGNYTAAVVIMCVFVAIGVAGYFLKDPVVKRIKSRKNRGKADLNG
ncbi:MAG: TVP38/TMEM64 family protein [Oscillospiraceae bacterium]